MKKYYIRKNMIHMINDTYDKSFTRVTRRTFEKWLQHNVGIVEIMFNEDYSEYYRNNILIAYTIPFLTI